MKLLLTKLRDLLYRRHVIYVQADEEHVWMFRRVRRTRGAYEWLWIGGSTVDHPRVFEARS